MKRRDGKEKGEEEKKNKRRRRRKRRENREKRGRSCVIERSKTRSASNGEIYRTMELPEAAIKKKLKFQLEKENRCDQSISQRGSSGCVWTVLK